LKHYIVPLYTDVIGLAGPYCVLVAQGILWNFCSYHDQELCKSFNELNEHSITNRVCFVH